MNITTLRRSLLLLSLGSAVLVPSLLAATDTPPPPPHHHGAGPHEASFDPEQRLTRLTEKLNLTADQQAKIRPILVAQADAMKAIDNAALTGDQRREKLKALRKDNRAKIGEILTSEQRKLLRQEFRKHRGHKGHAAPPPSPAPAN